MDKKDSKPLQKSDGDLKAMKITKTAPKTTHKNQKSAKKVKISHHFRVKFQDFNKGDKSPVFHYESPQNSLTLISTGSKTFTRGFQSKICSKFFQINEICQDLIFVDVFAMLVLTINWPKALNFDYIT